MAETNQPAEMSEKLKALEAARLQIEKQFGAGAIMKLGSQPDAQGVEVIPSGSILLDEALGVGGYPRGRIIEMYGPESSGKTTLALHAIAEAQKLISEYPEYDTAVWEMHHTQKADSPSGTALEIAKVILDNCTSKTEIVTDEFKQKPEKHQLHVSSTRCGNVPGTHSVFFDGPADTIEIRHTARSREGFAYGAVHGLERLASGLKDGSIQKGRFYKMTEMF